MKLARLLLTLVLVLPALAFAQGIKPGGKPGPGAVVPPSAMQLQPYSAALSTPGCYPTGSYVGKDTPLTVTRATTQTVEYPNINQRNPGLIEEDGNTVSHVIFAPNIARNSEDISNSGTWSNIGSCSIATNQGTAPDKTSTMDKLQCTGLNDYRVEYAIIPSSSGPFTASAWLASDSGIKVETLGSGCYGQNVAPGAFCTRSDGGSCSVSTVSAMTHTWGNVTTTPVRFTITFSCLTPTDTVPIFLHDGQLAVTSNIGGLFWGMQINHGASVLPYVKTGAYAEGLIDTKSNAWTQNGTVPQNAATWNAPPTAGPYTASTNYYKLGTGSDVLDFSGDFTCTSVFTPSSFSGLQQSILTDMAANAGYDSGITTTGKMRIVNRSTGTVTATANTVLLGTANVASFGRSGLNHYVKMNGSATATAGLASFAVDTANFAAIGANNTGTEESSSNRIHEVYCTTTAFNETTVAALQAAVMAKINQPILKSCAANELAVNSDGSTGAQIYAAATNYALESQTSCVANAVQTPWSLFSSTCASDVALAPDGTASMDSWIGVSSSSFVQQAATLPSTASATASAWASKASGSGAASVGVQCSGGIVSACTCATSDGSACATTLASPNCFARATAVGTTPVRVSASATCTVATTSWTIVLSPGEWNVTSGTSNFWGAQLETGLYPTPYYATTTGTGTRNATVASIPLRDFSSTDTACFGVTYKPGQNWNVQSGGGSGGLILSSYVGALANAINLSHGAAATVVFNVYDNAGGNKNWTWTHGLTDRSTHRIVACTAAGTLSMYVDGAAVGSGAGAGTALQSATLTPIQIGAQNGSLQLDGSVTNLRVYPNQVYRPGM